MGGKSTIVPVTIDVTSGWQFTGATGALAAVSDLSDASWVSPSIAAADGIGHKIFGKMPSVSVPAGAAIESITVTVRASQATGSEPVSATLSTIRPNGVEVGFSSQTTTTVSPDSAIRDYVTYTAGVTLDNSFQTVQHMLSNLRWTLKAPIPNGAIDDLRVYRVSAEIVWNEAPQIVGLGFSPADASTRTTRPTIQWTYVDPEALPEYGFRVAVWPASDVADPLFPQSGYVFSWRDAEGTLRRVFTSTLNEPVSVLVTSATSWTVPIDLPNGSYRLMLQVADWVGPSGRLADQSVKYLDFTQSVTLPPAPRIGVAVWDENEIVAVVDAQGSNNMLTSDQADNEAGISTSWQVAGNTVQLDVSGVQFVSGAQSRRWRALAAADALIRTERVPAAAGEVYSAHAQVRSSVASRGFRADLRFTNDDGEISVVPGSPVTGTNTGWVTAAVNGATAPPGTTSVQLVMTAVSAGAGEDNWVDVAGIYPTVTAPAVWTRGGLVPEQRFSPERSADGGATWDVVPGFEDGVLGDTSTQRVSMVDRSTVGGVQVRYRVRTLHDDVGFRFSSVYSESTEDVTPVIDAFLLRDPTGQVPEALTLSIAGDLTAQSTERVGVFQPVGSERPVFVSDVVGGGVFDVEVQIQGQGDVDLLGQLRDLRSVLVLQTDMDGVAYWVRLGPEVSTTLQRSTSRRNAATRPYKVQLQLYQSFGPGMQTEVV